ncbi:type IX secretion system plug protein [Sphingobacterium bovistauri]|uniref:DUF5103 domain-containing protein n=1 Tax=Sphingobacterium bovistauri TaxID=2781959 RepID=A0ABS7Z483_9SPHI|nr:type IX secretion system plug protein domain-containing protein [Sphingobacterium bovistauri]MCA5003569.1 DUF5103 domain-containing protein [Sphingobacterium bovistauri]
MIQYKSFIISIVLLLINVFSYAQSRTKGNGNVLRTPKSTLLYDNFEYNNAIKSVRINLNDNEGLFPVLELDNRDYLTISFDDLRADIRSFYYSIEHCNADWSSSRVPVIDYLIGYEEDRIYTIQSSENTKVPYTHYTFKFPNENMRPKIAGNYLLKVYEDADKSRLLFSRKLYVLTKSAVLDIEFIPSMMSNLKAENQKINIIVNSFNDIVNPSMNLHIRAFQNQRMDMYQKVNSPSSISSKKICYTLPNTFEFKGNNEFRMIDLRSTRNTSANVKRIFIDTIFQAKLDIDDNTSATKYYLKPDENGRFFIRNIDFEMEDIQSDYINTQFSLKDSANIKGDIYLVGGFNNFNTNSKNKLIFNITAKVWETTQLLKQGIYNYEYVLKNNDKIISDKFSGSHYDTENEYQVLLYYRKPGTYWDEIIGFVNSKNTK